jgi:hypothetical protein
LHYLHLVEKTDLLECLKKKNINNAQELTGDLLKAINVSKADFDDYLDNSIKKYRDKFVAHFDLEMHAFKLN